MKIPMETATSSLHESLIQCVKVIRHVGEGAPGEEEKCIDWLAGPGDESKGVEGAPPTDSK